MWITLNMKLNYVDEELLKEKLKENNAFMPTKPSLEKEAKKVLNINKKDLLNLNKKIIDFYLIDQDASLNIIGNAYINFRLNGKVSIVDSYYIKKINNHKEVEDFIELVNKYNEFMQNHKDVMNYNASRDYYISTKNSLIKQMCFVKSEYNQPGYLIQLQDFNTKKYCSFLLGSKSNITAYFNPKSDVIRCKKLVNDEDIKDCLIFE